MFTHKKEVYEGSSVRTSHLVEALDKTWQLKRLNLSDVDVTDIPSRTKFVVIEYMKLAGNYTMEEIEKVANYLRVQSEP